MKSRVWELDGHVVAEVMADGRWRLPVEVALWTLSFLVLALPMVALVLTSLVPAVGVPLDAATATLDNYRFVLFDHAAAKREIGRAHV